MFKLFSILFLALAGLAVTGCAAKALAGKKKTYKISGSVTETFSYCNGASPSKEILDRLQTPKPIPFARLGFKRLDQAENATAMEMLTTDSEGNFSINLSPGKYGFFEEWKTKPLVFPPDTKTETTDTACFRKLYQSADFEMTVAQNAQSNTRFNFHRRCFYNKPCIHYTGPMPH